MPLTTGLSYRIFMGLHLKPDLRLLLEQSATWKRIQPPPLTLLELQGKQYLGLLSDGDKISLDGLYSLKHAILQQIKDHCHDYDGDQAQFYVIPQVFLS